MEGKKDVVKKRNNSITSANQMRGMAPKLPSTVKQKSEASIIGEDNAVKERDLYMYLL